MHTLLSALRALFVLGCLVMVPLMAVFGTALPATLIAAISGQDSTSVPAPSPKSTATPISSTAATALPKTALPSESPIRPVANQAWAGTETAAAQVMAIPVAPSGDVPKFDAAQRATEGQASTMQPPVQPAPGAVALPAVPSREKFSTLEIRLQELGAKYYRLLTAGDQNELFRFECQLPIAGNAAAPRTFEATDADPLQAVARVVHQVEDFRSGRWQ